MGKRRGKSEREEGQRERGELGKRGSAGGESEKLAFLCCREEELGERKVRTWRRYGRVSY